MLDSITELQDSLFIYNQPGHDIEIVLKFTPQEIEMVRSSWKEMVNDDNDNDNNFNSTSTTNTTTTISSSLFCVQFYNNLLTMDSNLEKMFPSIKHQAISFAGVLSTAIINLNNLKVLDDYLLNLGKRHSRILGIEPFYFELMGIALLKTFKDRFGNSFNLENEKCWARLYTYLANSILKFGIDPIIKLDINYHIIPNNNTNNQLKKINSITSSLFDERSTISTSNTSIYSIPQSQISQINLSSSPVQQIKYPKQPLSQNSYSSSMININNIGKSQPSNNVQLNQSRINSSADRFKKRMANSSNSTASGMHQQDEKCTIM
ncbi:hypothetical protein WICMUC_000064 [Wickerhamomyces mucosus]|uniref:Globin domain-containing protein n=1 Tax=Wickerhamomyces mucosus TaxID=1378264 RepID=A0A9P8PYZ2_9ASCO|nr:hypothetical protein WICMUC_000064 [Wickerhamomyces mucosus]